MGFRGNNKELIESSTPKYLHWCGF